MATQTSANSRMRPVSFRTEDGWQIRGSYWEGRDVGALSLLLVHDHSANRDVWEPYVGFFLSRGWSVLTFDLRGHGESVRHDTRSALLTEAREGSLEDGWPLDVLGALAYAATQPRADATKCAIVGVGLGADLAYAAAARDWGAASVVAVSPNDTRARRFAGTGTFTPRGASLLYGDLDATANAAAIAFASAGQVPAECYAYESSSATGMALWEERQPEIVARAIAWIERVG
jgi:pimeloyl-ACP methyl ester carboxylesterase